MCPDITFNQNAENLSSPIIRPSIPKRGFIEMRMLEHRHNSIVILSSNFNNTNL